MKKFFFVLLNIFLFCNNSFAYDFINNKRVNLSIDGNISNFIIYNKNSNKYFNFKSLNELSLNYSFETEGKNKIGIFSSVIPSPKTSYMIKNNLLSEIYLYTETNYGRFETGLSKNISSKMHFITDSFISNINYISGLDFLFDNFNYSFSSNIIEDSNALKFSYISPEFYSFQIGGSFIPKTIKDLNKTNLGNITKGYNLSIKQLYDNKTYNFKFITSYGYFQKENNLININEDIKVYSTGISFYDNGLQINTAFKYTNIYNKLLSDRNNFTFIYGIAYELGAINIDLTDYYSFQKILTDKYKFNLLLTSFKYNYNKYFANSFSIGITSRKKKNLKFTNGILILGGLSITF